MNDNDASARARAYFPRGLAQPAESFRFSIDALLLASFAAKALRSGSAAQSARLLDIGCGCGAAMFGTLLELGAPDAPHISAAGLDVNNDLLDAARRNASALGLAGQTEFIRLDLRNSFGQELELAEAELSAGSYDLVLSNPPYRLPGTGRLPQSESRRTALFADERTLRAFIRAASFSLKPGGLACFIFSAARLPELLEYCRAEALGTQKILPVHGKTGDQAGLALVLAMKGGDNAGIPPFETPLPLYGGEGENSRLTRQALEFCPFLSCNPQPAKK